MSPAAMTPVGLRALAVSFPRTVRTNDHWRERYPEMVATATDRTLSRVWSPQGDAETAFTIEMMPFLGDPFRGAVERRFLDPGQTALSLEMSAARQALSSVGMTPGDVDLLIAVSFLPDQLAVGNAAFLAKEMGLQCPAWNLEAACSGALVAFENACALVRAGVHRSVLVTVSCSYSRGVPETDTLVWSVGDGAAAFVVGAVPAGEGLLGMKTMNTADGCGAMYHEISEGFGIRMRAGRDAGATLQRTAERGLLECCRGALHAAGVTIDDIDYFAVPLPVAWYARFCSRALGFPLEKTINTHPLFANTGPVLMPTSLFFGARTGKIRPGSLVLLHTVGIASNASAAVVRWGHVGLGAMPEVALPV